MPSSKLTKVGIGREGTWGNGVAPQVLLPVEPPTFTEPYVQLLDQAMRGINAMDFGAYQGVSHAEASLAGNFHPEEMGFILLAMMGSTSPSGTATPYTHTFTLGSTPPSLSIQDEGGVYPTSGTQRRYTGMLPSSFTLTFNAAEALLTWSADFMGKGGEAGSGAIPADASTAPFRGWHGVVTIPAAYTRLISGEITFNREVAVRHGMANSQVPTIGYSGPLEVLATLTADAVDGTDIDRVLLHTSAALSIVFGYGSAGSLKELSLVMTNFNWGEGPVTLDRSGVYITQGMSGRAIYNATDAGPIKVTLKNARPTYTAA